MSTGKGSSSGGTNSGTTTSASTVTPNPQALAAYQQALSMANNASSAPLQTYQGQTVAGFTPDQLQAFQTTENTAGAAQPYLNTASQDIQGSTANQWSQLPQFSAATVGQYQSPYTQNVLNTTMAAENNQDAQQQAQLQGNAISAGAWGGDRSAVAQAQLGGQQAIANNATNAGIENTGYSTALGEFNNQQSTELGANEANAYLGSQAGFGNINLAQNATSLPLEQANAQAAAGAQEQSLNQANLNVPYENFLAQEAYPFQTAQFYSNIAEGVGSGMGSSSTSETTPPAPSTSSQVFGGLLGAGSLLGGALSNGTPTTPTLATGGRAHLATGGTSDLPSLALIPDFSRDFIPTSNGSSAGGAHALSGVGGGSGGGNGSGSAQSSMSGASIASGAKGLGQGLGALYNMYNTPSGTNFSGGIDPNTGNSNLTQSGINQDFVGGSGEPVSGNILTTGNDGSNLGSPIVSSDTTGLGTGSANAGFGTFSAPAASGDVASSAADSGSWMDSFGSLFEKTGGRIPHRASGGKIPQFKNGHKRYAIGGEVLPDVVSGVGDVIGAFFGDWGAGDQAVGILSNADGGATKGAGVETQLMGMAQGNSDSQTEDSATGSPGMGLNAAFNPGKTNAQGDLTSGLGQETGNGAGVAASFLARGGRPHYDDGGMISPVTGAAPAADTAPQNQQNQYSQISQLPMDKLQELQARMPATTPQGQMVQKAIKQKQFMPNGSAQQSLAGLSAPAAPSSGTALQVPQQQPAQSGLATGGRLKRDDGGYVPDVMTPDQIAQQQVTMQGLSPDQGDARQAAFMPPTSGPLAPPPTPQQIAAQQPSQQPVIPQINASALQQPNASSSAPSATSDALPQYKPSAPASDVVQNVADEDASSQTPQYKPTNRQPSAREIQKADPWEALATAGFAMMAGKSPYALENVGAGAQAGMQEYGAQRKEANTVNYQNSQLDQEAQKIADEAEYRNKSLAQSQSQFNTKQNSVSVTEQAQLDQAKELKEDELRQSSMKAAQDQWQIVPDQMGGFVKYNKKTGETQTIAGANSSMAPALDPKTGQPLTGDAYLATLPPENAAQIKAMDEGRLNFPAGFALKSPYWQQKLSQLYQYNPDASQQTAQSVKAFNTGPQGNQTRYLNVAVNHLDTLNGLTDALDNGDIKALNAAGNLWQAQTGSPAPTNFATARNIVGDEVTKAVVGAGGSSADRDKAQAVIDAANSPAQLKGAIQTYKNLMTGQLSGLKQQYETSTGRKDYDKYLTASAKSALTPQSSNAGQQGGQSAGIRVTSPTGQTGTISQAELADALRNGWKQVQ